MSEALTEQQNKFLEFLFSEEAQGDPKLAARLAGYNPDSVYKLIKSLKQEIIDRAEYILALYGPKAAFTLAGTLDTTAVTPSSTNRLEAAKQILDRIGLVKKEQIKVTGDTIGGIFILPAKKE